MKLDHLIYGTFPDLPGSQQVVYRSSGIPSEFESWLIQQYDQFGDCKTEDFRSSLTLQWYRETESPVAVLTKVTHAGQDFSGRWGALLRHSAIITPKQMQSLYYDVSPVAAHLVATGSAEQLAQSGNLDIETPNSLDHLIDEVLALNLEHYRSNLKRLLCGERLVLYADLNTAHLNRYLRNLLLLMPLQIRASLNWSEFVFHSLETLDLSIVHSSRYAAPEGDTVEFQADGDNSLGDLSISSEAADDYIANLAQQLGEPNRGKLAALFTEVEIADQPESAGD